MGFLWFCFPGTFFTPFLNGFNQFTTRFNPFGRPLSQSQPVFQQFPTQQSSFRRPVTVNPNSFQSVRFQQPPQQPQQFAPQPQQPQTQFGVQQQQQQQSFGVQSQQPPAPPPQQQQPPQQPFTAFNLQPQPQRPPFTAFNQQQFASPQDQQQPEQQSQEQGGGRPDFTPLQREPPQPSFNNQPQVFTQGPQRFPPESSVSSSFGLTSGSGSQTTSDFRQSFGRPEQPPPSPALADQRPQQQPPAQSFDDESESFRSSGATSQSAIDNTFVNFPGRVPLRQPFPPQNEADGVRVRIRPVGTIGNTDPTQFRPGEIRGNTQSDVLENTSPRARQPIRLDDSSSAASSDFEPTRGPTGVRVVRVRPTNGPRFRTENFTPSEFIPGSQEVTPPPVITRVRGRPIVPEDFPGSPLAIRGKTPEDELDDDDNIPIGPGAEVVDNDDNFTRGRVPLTSTGNSGTRTRTRVRIVPTGNRARRPVVSGGGRDPEPSELPRTVGSSLSNSNGRPSLNRVPFGILNEDSNGNKAQQQQEQVRGEDEEEIDISGFPGSRRRLRPINRVTSPRRLRPFNEQETTSPTLVTEEPIVPTAPAVTRDQQRDRNRVQDLLSQTLVSNKGGAEVQLNNPSSATSGDAHFDPNHLLAHVQAVKAAEESHNEDLKNNKKEKNKALDDSEESNIIPLSAIPTISSSDVEAAQDDATITLINLQKDKSKGQTFKSFVDTDSIDGINDNVRSPPIPFIPTRAPPPLTTIQEFTTTTTTTRRTTTTTTSTTTQTTSRETTATSSTETSTSLSDFRPTFRSTSRRTSLNLATTTTPFVRIPFGPFSPNEHQRQKQEQQQNNNNNKNEPPKVSISVSTSIAKSSSSSSSSEASFESSPVTTTSSTTRASTASSSAATSSTSKGIISFDELDSLQSSLDPWARIQQQQKENAEKNKKNQHNNNNGGNNDQEVGRTPEPPTTSRISLFKIRTLAPITTRKTTTFKPRSLADLFKHRDGIKIGDPDSEDDEQFERPTTESFVTSTTSRPVFTPSRNQASSGIETLRNRKNNNNNKFSNRFKPSTEQSTGGFGSTTSRPKLGGFKSRTTKGPTVGDLLAKIPKDTLSSSLLPKDFQERRPGFGSRRPSINSGGSIGKRHSL